MSKKKPRAETPKALQAFEDYYAMGFERTLRGLLRVYEQRAEAGKPVPTLSLSVLEDWSRELGWQERTAAREQEENDEMWEAMKRSRTRERIRDLRRVERMLQGHDSAMAMLVQEGKPLPMELKPTDMASLITLRQKLMGTGLVDSTVEVSGRDGKPIAVEVDLDIPDEQLSGFLSSAAAILRSGDSAEAGDAETKG